MSENIIFHDHTRHIAIKHHLIRKNKNEKEIEVNHVISHYEKKEVLELALQFNFGVIEDTCNSLYLYNVSANGQVA